MSVCVSVIYTLAVHITSCPRGMKKRKRTRILLSGPGALSASQTTKALSVTIRMNVYLVFISRNGSVFHLENDSEGNCYAATAADYIQRSDCMCSREMFAHSPSNLRQLSALLSLLSSHTAQPSHQNLTSPPSARLVLTKTSTYKKYKGYTISMYFSIRVFVIYIYAYISVE